MRGRQSGLFNMESRVDREDQRLIEERMEREWTDIK
jgi:hypothetical protein